MTGSAKQSIEPQRKMDCFVATLLAMTVSPFVPARRPCESRDPYAASSRFGRGGRNLLSHCTPLVIAPAFARTTKEDSIVKQQTRLYAPRRVASEGLCPLPSDNRGRGEYRVPLQRPPHPISTSVTIAKRPAFGMGRRRV